MLKNVIFHDTTLRDGEQSPGIVFTSGEKLDIALELEKIGIDSIETGFPSCSIYEFEAAQKISKKIKNASVAGLCRCNRKDIDITWDALHNAQNPQIILFVATSDIHIHYKLRLNREKILSMVRDSVSYAKNKFSNVTFGAEDATRSDFEYLSAIYKCAINAGANCVGIGDTLGCLFPEDVRKLVSFIINKVENIEKAVLEVHFHNDLGLAAINTLEALKLGAQRVSGTINGIGERAGNVALEQIVLLLHTNQEKLNLFSKIEISEMKRVCELISDYADFHLNEFNSVMMKKEVRNLLKESKKALAYGTNN